MSEEELKHNHDCNCNDESCDCGCEDLEDLGVVYLEQEDGTEVGLPIVDEFEYGGTVYVVVDDDDNEVSYIFEVVEKEGEETLEPVTDDMFDEVSEYYQKLVDGEIGEDEE